MNIGIGICTYNRSEACDIICRNIDNTLDSEHSYQKVIGLDHFDNSLYSNYCKEEWSFITHKNYGISINKSIILKYLYGNDIIFLFEDDIYPKINGWVNNSIKVIENSGINFFNIFPIWIIKNFGTPNIDKITINDVCFLRSNAHTAQLMVITKKCIDTIGVLDPDYKGYGFEHCDYTRKAIANNLTYNNHNSYIIPELLIDKFEFMDIPNTTNEDVRKDQIFNNQLIYNRNNLKKVNIDRILF